MRHLSPNPHARRLIALPLACLVLLALNYAADSTASAQGRYAFANLVAGGTYTVAPLLAKYTFAQPSQTVANPSGNQTADFTGVRANETSLGPASYLCQSDSPFVSSIRAGTTVLETFEDGALNTPGVTASAGGVTGPGGLTDSVDCDEGQVDGSGTNGRSFFSGSGAAGITFTFSAAALDGLPTQAGIVWTDGEGTTTFEAFDANNNSLGVIGPVLIADNSFSGTTAEDRFFGVVHEGGISAIKISNTSGGIEVDHLQYGRDGAAECISPPQGVLAWYPGEGNAVDIIDSKHGALQGGVTFAEGVIDRAFNFDGVNGSVDLGNWFNLQTFTVDTWVKAGANQVAFADIIDNNHTDFRSWVIQYTNTGSRYQYGSADGGGSIFFNLTPGTWQHLAVTRDADNVSRLYLDGELIGSVTGSGPIAYDGTQFLRLARWGGGGRNWNGQLDEVEVFNRALSQAEIQAIYNAGSAGKCKEGIVTTVTVTNTNDSGAGSLRQAILDANATTTADTIAFNIPGAGVRSISPLSALPNITSPVTIDGTTQPGFAGAPIVELNGTSAGASTSGLILSGGNSTVRGLVINRFGGTGILVQGTGGNRIEGNFIGTDAAGTADLGNNSIGVDIVGSQNNFVGGATAGAKNVISGNNQSGVRAVLSGAAWNRIEGNFIGTDVSGGSALANSVRGVLIQDAPNNLVGGTTSGASNVISGNGNEGVLIFGPGSTGNLVQGNLIGTNAAGTAALANTLHGVSISNASGNAVGGAVPGARNVTSGNGQRGIFIGGTSQNNVVEGNYVGTNAAGTAAVKNGFVGVTVAAPASNNRVGGPAAAQRNVISGNDIAGVSIESIGTVSGPAAGNLIQNNFIGVAADGTTPLGNTPGAQGGSGVIIVRRASNNAVVGNLIANNSGPGVAVADGTEPVGTAVGNRVSGNSIFSNGGLGIDLGSSGVTRNDAGDADAGANNFQNFPVVSLTAAATSTTSISGTLNSTPNTTFTIELFANSQCDGSGFGEGRTLVGTTTATTDGGGNASFTAGTSAVQRGQFVTATATNPGGNTSEFSRCVQVTASVVSSVSPSGGPESGGTQVTITGSNFADPNAGATTVLFGNTPATNVAVVSNTTITATAPAGRGQVAVVVRNSNGDSNVNVAFTYEPPPLANPQPAIIGTSGDGNLAAVFPRPDQNLPATQQNVVTGLPANAQPHGVAYFASDNALLSDFANSRVFVVQISTNSLLATINTTGTYNGTGTITVAPNLNFALASGGASGGSTTTGDLAVMRAPFNATSAVTTVPLPGQISAFQTQAIVFDTAGRAFVFHTTGISVLEPPYTGIAFTIPVNNSSGRALAITPDGRQLLATDQSGVVRIFTAPFSAASTPETLTISPNNSLNGISVTPDGQTALVVESFRPRAYAVRAPFNSNSPVEELPLAPAVVAAGRGFEDVGISADGQIAILTGQSAGNTGAPAAFIRAPFTAAGARSFAVDVVGGGRGGGAVRFLPPGLAPGLTVSKSAADSVQSGTNLTYTITYGNTGNVEATNVVVRDRLPAGTTFVSATGGGSFGDGFVTWNVGAVPAGATGRTLSLTVRVGAAAGSTVSNSDYAIEGAGVAPIPGPPVTTGVAAAGPRVTLTGLFQFSANSSGGASGGQRWNTLGPDGSFNLYAINGELGGTFVNSANASGASINLPLPDGDYIITTHGEPGSDTGFAGLNLFFNGNNSTPGISVFAPTRTSAETVPAFAANSGSTFALNGTTAAGAGTLTFTNGSAVVTLTSYYWAIPRVFATDRVAASNNAPSGANDFVGQFRLSVRGANSPTSSTVSGRVTDADGDPLPGVTVALSGSSTASATTDAQGRYAFANLAAGGTYTVTPAREGYSFTPPSRTFENLSSDQTADFSGVISVLTPAGTNVTLTTDVGTTTFAQVTAPGMTTFTPIDPATAGAPPPGYSFAPGVPAVDISTTATTSGPITVCLNVPNVTDPALFASIRILHGEGGALVDRTSSRDFASKRICATVPSLSPFVVAIAQPGSIGGRALASTGGPLAGVTVTLTTGAQSAMTQTDAQGNYSFANLPAGSTYTVTAGRTGFTFMPPQHTFERLAGSQTADFVGSGAFTISGRVSGLTSTDGVTVTLSGARSAVTSVGPGGEFTFADLPGGGNYKATPQAATFTFSPIQFEFLNLGGDARADFSASAVANPTPTPSIEDDFSGTTRDPEKFAEGTLTQPPGATDPLVTVVQQDGRLVVTPRTNFTGLSFNGYVTNKAVDFTDATASVQVDQIASGGAQTIFAVGRDDQNFFRFVAQEVDPITQPSGKSRGAAVRNTLQQLLLQERRAGFLNSLSIPYDPVAHKFWRFRHTSTGPPAPGIAFEVSPTGVEGTWDVVRFVPVAGAIGRLAVEVGAGTDRAVSNPGKAIFDNLSVVPSQRASRVGEYSLSAASLTVAEGAGSLLLRVRRVGLLSAESFVDLVSDDFSDQNRNEQSCATLDGKARGRCDFSSVFTRLRFAPGEAEKAVTVFVTDDTYAEGSETFWLALGNASAGFVIDAPALTVTVLDDDQPGARNPINDADFFVRQQYLDFLGREPEAAGFEAWTGVLRGCAFEGHFGPGKSGSDPGCDRILVSSGFYRSPEFHERGYFAYRFYEAALGRRPTYDEFLSDMQLLAGPRTPQELEASKVAFVKDFMARQGSAGRRSFRDLNGGLDTPARLDQMLARAGLTLAARDRLAADLSAGRVTPGQVLRAVAESDEASAKFYNSGFVAMQYFGYLQRDPEEAGFRSWLNLLNANPQDFRTMIFGFLYSQEYQSRFGPVQ